MASSKETYCLCGQPYNIGQFMIECDCCREWFHGSCVDVKVYQSDDIDKYHCPKCAPTYGPSVLKIPTNNHRSDRYELGAEARPSQVGSPAWVRALAARPLRPSAAALHRMRGEQFTEEFVRDNGFTRPVIFYTPEGLDMKTPNPATFTVRSVLRYCGAQLEVEVIDVRKQSTLRMPLGDFVEYFETPPEHRDEKVLNVISLEVSDTSLSPLVSPPGAVRALDWAERVWPSAEPPPRPAVQKYCLVSAQGSYTDFHVDFGGTTVWYHVLQGRKIFYLVPPTATNLALYQQWGAANNQNEKFFGDMVEWYGTVALCEGQTLLIPAGWLHAVLTPADSIVLGGNFLHSYAIETQLQIYEMERVVETPHMFRYPLFEHMQWYAAASLLTLLRRHNEEVQDEEFTLNDPLVVGAPAPLPPLLLRGIKILASALKEWHALKSTETSKRENVPKCLNSGQLVRELCKELRTIEKRAAAAQNKDKDFKIKSNSPNKSQNKKQTAKKSLKLTLPKPIMHMGRNGEFAEEKVCTDKFYIDNKEVIYQDSSRYIPQDVKYNGQEKYTVVDSKEAVLTDKYAYAQSYDEQVTYQDGEFDRQDKKTVLKIKLNSPPSSSAAPPPYPIIPEHSILKSHLVRPDRGGLKSINHWTISKKDIGDFNDEQILFTNENSNQNVRLDAHELNYGPGMYSTEDIQTDYQYCDAGKPGSYPPPYTYQPQINNYTNNYHYIDNNLHQTASYSNVPEPLSTFEGTPLPSYDAAIAQQHFNAPPVAAPQPPAVPATGAPDTPAEYPAATRPRRSERAVRRRVSNTYDYEDGDLFIDDAPPPARHRNSSNSNNYRRARAAPTNGIESLIQASELAEGEPPSNDTEDAAVAGMLSISERYTSSSQRTFGLAADSPAKNNKQNSSNGGRRSRKGTAPTPAPAANSADEEYQDEDVIKEVHRDEEYVYPSLEMSSDEDEDWTASRRRRNSRNKVDNRGRADKDEAWSPRARLGRLVPRLRLPARAGVRRECVRAALHAAAHHAHHVQTNAKRAVLATKSKRPPPPAPPASSSKNARLKKGMKTAKQRLGKILKIHKMIY